MDDDCNIAFETNAEQRFLSKGLQNSFLFPKINLLLKLLEHIFFWDTHQPPGCSLPLSNTVTLDQDDEDSCLVQDKPAILPPTMATLVLDHNNNDEDSSMGIEFLLFAVNQQQIKMKIGRELQAMALLQCRSMRNKHPLQRGDESQREIERLLHYLLTQHDVNDTGSIGYERVPVGDPSKEDSVNELGVFIRFVLLDVVAHGGA